MKLWLAVLAVALSGCAVKNRNTTVWVGTISVWSYPCDCPATLNKEMGLRDDGLLVWRDKP